MMTTNRRGFFGKLAVLMASVTQLPTLLERLPTSTGLTVIPCHPKSYEDPFDAFRLATESLPRELYARANRRSVWMDMVPRGKYPERMGDVR